MKTLDRQRDFARAYELGHPIEGPMKKQRQGHDAFDETRQAYVEEARRVVGPRLD
jgi:hypothetical protein